MSLSPSVTPAAPGILNATLRAAMRRLRGLLFLRYAAAALCVSAALGLLLVGLSKLRLLPPPTPWLLVGLIALGLGVAAALALLRPLSLLAVAKLTEQRADLKERLSSAVEFQARGLTATDSFYAEQLADAERHAMRLRLNALYPVRLPRTLFFGLAATMALLLSYYLPTLPLFWTPQMRQETVQVQQQGVRLVKLAEERNKEADQKKLTETKKAAEEAKKLGEAMKKGQMNKKQSLVATQKLTKKVEDSQKKLAAALPQKSLEQARQEAIRSLEQRSQDLMTAQQEKAAQNPRKLPESKKSDERMARQKSESAAMNRAQQMLQQVAQAMQNQNRDQMQKAIEELTQQMQPGKLSPQEMQKLNEQLQKLAAAFQGTQFDKLSQEMQTLLQQLQQQRNRLDPKTREELANLMQQLGQGMCQNSGDLSAMQLDAEALKKLLEDLKSGRLQLALGQMPGQNQKVAPVPVPSSGKGGSKAGFGATNPDRTKIDQKFAKTRPDAKAIGKRSLPSADLQITMQGDPERVKSAAPYYQTYQTSKRAAENALNKENLPAAYKKQVRDYFDSIRP